MLNSSMRPLKNVCHFIFEAVLIKAPSTLLVALTRRDQRFDI